VTIREYSFEDLPYCSEKRDSRRFLRYADINIVAIAADHKNLYK
jgi:hypothetical protein